LTIKQSLCSASSYAGCRRDALPAFAAERRAAAPCCGAVAARRPQQSIDISSQGAQQQTFRTPLLLSIDGTDGRTDGSTTVT